MVWYEDKDSHKSVYVDITENDFTKHHDFRIRSTNESFLNYIENVYHEENKSISSNFSALLSSIKGCKPRLIPNGVIFRYRKDGYKPTSEEIMALLDFCKMIGLRFKICDRFAGKYRRLDIKKLPKVLERLDKKYS